MLIRHSPVNRTKTFNHLAVIAMLCVSAWCVTPSVLAEQIEVTGKAKIVNGDIDKAREDAISQALNYASLKAGVNFSSEQQVNQGRLTQDTFQIQRMGSANNVELMSEMISQHTITVVLQLELSEQEPNAQCKSQSLKAAIMLPQAYLQEREQLRYGQLAHFEERITEQLGKAINAQSRYSFARLHADEKIPQVAIDAINIDVVGAKTVQLAQAIGNGLGKRFYNNLVALAQKKTYTNSATMIDAIAEGIQTFTSGASVLIDGASDTTFSNSTNGILPTTLVVSTVGLKKLRQDADFKALFDGQGNLPGTIGTLFGLQVVYSQHLDTIDVIPGTGGVQPAEFVLLNFQGVAFPYSLNMLRAIPSENFNGVRLQAEVVYPDHAEASVLVIDSYAMAFTEAAA